jgi:hypothetical protein
VAVNQAVKALVPATGYLKGDGISIICVPEFAEVTIEDKVRTASEARNPTAEYFAFRNLQARDNFCLVFLQEPFTERM